MKLPVFFLAILAFSTSAFANSFVPMSQDTPASIEYRVATANSSIGLVKHFLGQIQIHSDDPQFVQDTVGKAMKYLWNVEACLGQDHDSMDQSSKRQ